MIHWSEWRRAAAEARFGFAPFWHVRIISAVTRLVTRDVDKWILRGTVEKESEKNRERRTRRRKSPVGEHAAGVRRVTYISLGYYARDEFFLPFSPLLRPFASFPPTLSPAPCGWIKPHLVDHCSGFLPCCFRCSSAPRRDVGVDRRKRKMWRNKWRAIIQLSTNCSYE